MNTRLINPIFYDNFVDNLLKCRGIDNPSVYYNPTPNLLQSPKNLRNIGVGAALYERIVNNNGKILVIVDSDVDGFTSSAIIYQYTKKMNPNCHVDYWLHSGKQHGLQDHIHKLLEQDEEYDLILLPDAGSNDVDHQDRLDAIGIPCLVLDHHQVDVETSNNAIVINNQISPNYTNKELTGAGVTWQFCRYLDEKNGTNWAEEFIDLAALGDVADMCGMNVLENRYIVYEGFKNIRNDLFMTFARKQAYSITGKTAPSDAEIIAALNPISVAFYIVPLINALIRVGTMREKEMLFEAFLDGSKKVESGKRGAKGELERIDVEVARICTNARNKQNKLLDEMVGKAEIHIAKHDLLENKILVYRLEDYDNFPSEINGLLAMKLSAKYQRPTLVLRRGPDGKDKGSARGVNKSKLTSLKDYLLTTGLFDYAQGHAQAFGCSLDDKNLDKFHRIANEQLKDYNFGENYYDVNFQSDAYSDNLAKVVLDIGTHSSIWGQKMEEPLLEIRNISLSNIRIMGSNKDTVRIDCNGIAFMMFKAKDFIEEINNSSGTVLNIVGRANLNEWNGNITPQIFIEDYEFISKEKVYEF